MVQGVRAASRKKSPRAGLLQVGSLLQLEGDLKPNRNLQHLRSFHPAYIYTSLQEEISKNAILIFCVELLQRLLPEEETMPELFRFIYDYFVALDKSPVSSVGNFPLYFIVACGRELGYHISGNYGAATPFLDAQEGTFSAVEPLSGIALQPEDITAMAALLAVDRLEAIATVQMNGAMRSRLLDWYIQFLQHHTQHLGTLRSPEILHQILHQ
jgi:DNA repair protein RecO (recombination protein O)